MDGDDLGAVTDNLMALHRYGWRRGLKTGSYYVRTRVKFGGQKFALSGSRAKAATRREAKTAAESVGASDKTSSDSELSGSGSEDRGKDHDQEDQEWEDLPAWQEQMSRMRPVMVQRRGAAVPASAASALDTEEKMRKIADVITSLGDTVLATAANRLVGQEWSVLAEEGYKDATWCRLAAAGGDDDDECEACGS